MKMINNMKKIDRELVFRIASLVLSSIFFAHIPLLLFLIYMGTHGFFSYDFFKEGVFGLKVFFFLSCFIVLLISLALFWWIEPLFDWIYNKQKRLVSLICTIFFNGFFWILLVGTLPNNSEPFKLLYLVTIGVFVTIHISALIHAKPSFQIRTLIGTMLVVTSISLYMHQQASEMLGGALKVFGVGGGIQVTLNPKMLEDEELCGELVLLTPENIYIRLENSGELSTISRQKYDVLTVQKADNTKG